MRDNDEAKREERRNKVTVMCAHRGGLQLRLHKPHHVQGQPGLSPDPEKLVVLNHGANPDLDRDFIEAWREENAGSDLLQLVTIAEQVDVEGGKPGEDHITEKPDNEASITDPAPKQEDEGEEKSPESPAP